MSLGDVRTAIATTLDSGTRAAVYKGLKRAPDLPAIVVGWPESLDFRAAMGGLRNYVIGVELYVEVRDEDGADDALETLVEEAVTSLTEQPGWDVQPSTDWGETLTADGRNVLACRLPVVIYE